MEKKGVLVRSLTLHVGTGTFKPIRVENPEEHRMDAEFFEIGGALLETIREVKESGGRVVSVGTTTTRAIEGFLSGRREDRNGSSSKVAGESSRKQMHLTPDFDPPQADRLLNSHNGSFIGKTDIFIYPGYQFKAVDSLLTNFHLPRSTPLMLTSAFSGMKPLLEAYRSAVSMKYRFFSYGDAMLVL
jgi:S-adenosylmethionine:tRNA ribosyltransferase-isomerase